MFRSLVFLAFCLGLVFANVSKRKATKYIVKRDAPCDYYEFTCQNRRCVQEEWTCDGDDDCGDGSDESLAECPPQGQCTSAHQVRCNNGDCEPLEYRCDGDNDCGDGTDESGCDLFPCYTGEWKCGNGRCIEGGYICDGDNDCGDRSDEQNCPS